MANWWENDPIVETGGGSAGWWSSDPIVEEPKRPKGFVSGMRDVAGGLLNELLAGTQRTSPVMSSQGTPLGQLVPTDTGSGFVDRAGKLQELDTRKHVTLIEPGSGKSMVYARTSETDEGLAAGAGRVLGFGAMAPAPTRLAGGAQAARAAPTAEGAITPQQLIADFDKLDIPPSLAAVASAGGGRLSKTPSLVQNVLKGTVGIADIQARDVQKTLAAAGRAAASTAGRYGTVTSRQGLGRDIKEGIEQVTQGRKPGATAEQAIKQPTRATSFQDKSAALYDRFWSHFQPAEQIDMAKSIAALKRPGQRFQNIELGQEFVDPKLARWADIIERNGGKLSIEDARSFRSEIGPMLKPSLSPDVNQAQLSRVYGALSEDIKGAAAAKGANASFDLARADKYYAAAKTRWERIEKVLGSEAGENIYESVHVLGKRTGSRSDIDLMRKVRKSLPGEEWNDFSATVVRQLGRPTKGNVDPLTADIEEFSPGKFVSDYDDLSKEAKDLLFDSAGKSELRKELDALNRSMGAEKNVEKLANPSGSGRYLQTIGMAVASIHSPLTVIALMGGGLAAEKLIMSPTFVRWLYRAPKTQKGSPEWTRWIAQLRLMPIDAELRPETEALADRLSGDQSKTTGQPNTLQ